MDSWIYYLMDLTGLEVHWVVGLTVTAAMTALLVGGTLMAQWMSNRYINGKRK